MAHPGPSRTIIVEPLTTPARRPAPREQPARREPQPPRRAPDRPAREPGRREPAVR